MLYEVDKLMMILSEMNAMLLTDLVNHESITVKNSSAVYNTFSRNRPARIIG